MFRGTALFSFLFPILSILLSIPTIVAFSPSNGRILTSQTSRRILDRTTSWTANNVPVGSKSKSTSCITLSMGIFDAFSKAFANQEYGPPAEQVRATARHILVPTKEEAQIVMKMITSGEQTFEECAQQFSTCPSASKGGSLGSFGPGTMVKEFDQVIFSPETRIGEVMGPVLTQFGHHVILVEKRTGGGDWY